MKIKKLFVFALFLSIVGFAFLINITPVLAADHPPTAENVTMAVVASQTAGHTVIGFYNYVDQDGDSESNSTFQWYRNEDLINLATQPTYVLTEADDGQDITFGVTPVNSNGHGELTRSTHTWIWDNDTTGSFTVNSTDDVGGEYDCNTGENCTLRGALNRINNLSIATSPTIHIAVPGTTTTAHDLPSLGRDATTITGPDDGTFIVDGDDRPFSVGLNIFSDHNDISGFAIKNFRNSDIIIFGANSNNIHHMDLAGEVSGDDTIPPGNGITFFQNTEGNIISLNQIHGNNYGIYFWGANDNFIQQNTIFENLLYGINLAGGAQRNHIDTDNEIYDNGSGIYFDGANNNLVDSNNIHDNGLTACKWNAIMPTLKYGDDVFDASAAFGAPISAVIGIVHGNFTFNIISEERPCLISGVEAIAAASGGYDALIAHLVMGGISAPVTLYIPHNFAGMITSFASAKLMMAGMMGGEVYAYIPSIFTYSDVSHLWTYHDITAKIGDPAPVVETVYDNEGNPIFSMSVSVITLEGGAKIETDPLNTEAVSLANPNIVPAITADDFTAPIANGIQFTGGSSLNEATNNVLNNNGIGVVFDGTSSDNTISGGSITSLSYDVMSASTENNEVKLCIPTDKMVELKSGEITGSTCRHSSGSYMPGRGPNTVKPAAGPTVPPVTPLTVEPIKEVKINLFYGMKTNEVKILQEFLMKQNKGPAALKLKSVGATGYFGTLTRLALAEWQKSNGILPSAGYFGPLTRDYILKHI